MRVQSWVAEVGFDAEAALVDPPIIVMLRPTALSTFPIALTTVIILIIPFCRLIFVVWIVDFLHVLTARGTLLLVHPWLLHLAWLHLLRHLGVHLEATLLLPLAFWKVVTYTHWILAIASIYVVLVWILLLLVRHLFWLELALSVLTWLLSLAITINYLLYAKL